MSRWCAVFTETERSTAGRNGGGVTAGTSGPVEGDSSSSFRCFALCFVHVSAPGKRGQRWQAPTCKEVLVVEVDVEKACARTHAGGSFGSTQAKKARPGERERERERSRFPGKEPNRRMPAATPRVWAAQYDNAHRVGWRATPGGGWGGHATGASDDGVWCAITDSLRDARRASHWGQSPTRRTTNPRTCARLLVARLGGG